LSTNQYSKYLNIGRLKNIYKLNGYITCKLTDFGIDLVLPGAEIWVKVAKDEFLPVTVEKIKRFNSQYILKFKNINSSDDANIFQEGELLKKDKILKEDSSSTNFDGFSVYNKKKQLLGMVVSELEIPGNPLFLIKIDKKEVMVPINEEFINFIDSENKKMIIQNFEKLLQI